MFTKMKTTTMIAALIGGLTTGVVAQDESELDKKIERIIEKKLNDRSSGNDDIFSKNVSDLGVEIHGHLQFEYEDFESEGSRGGDGTFDNQYFTLWIGKQINDDLEVAVEIEYEHGGTGGQTGGTGGGGGGETEIDQAQATWRPLGEDTFKLRFGKFYVPFGIERFSYAGPYNRMVSRPSPFQNVYPGTYADTGVQALGAIPMGEVSLNYEIAVVNGLGPDAAVDIRDSRQGRDNNDNKAFVGRVGVAFTKNFEIGTSWYISKYNEFQVNGHALAPDNEHYLKYNGVDARLQVGNLDIRGELIDSFVETGETVTNGFRNFRRQGYYVQTAYRVDVERSLCQYIDVITRFDSKDEDTTVQNTADTNTWAYGLGWGVNDNMTIKFEHQKVHERGPVKLDNDAFLAQVSVKF